MPAQIHWKTGTSFGFRDAWAVGSGPRYTAVVWTGNVDNKPSAELVGSEAAGPLLFDVLEALAGARTHDDEQPPGDLAWIEVCAYSGHVPTAACEHRTKVLAPIHAVPTAPCPYHKTYAVDAAGRAVPPACKRDLATVGTKTFVVLPSAVVAWLAGRERTVPDQPVLADGCAPDGDGAPPVITTPADGQVVTLIPGVPAAQQLVPLSASTRAPSVTWFVDGALLGTAASSEKLYWTPIAGKHDVVAADDAGRKARRTITVMASR